jgi:hypothetical protein
MLALALCLAVASRALQMERLARAHEQMAMTSAAAWGAARVAAKQGAPFQGHAGALTWKAAPAAGGRSIGNATLEYGPKGKVQKKLRAQAVLGKPGAGGH